MQRSAENRLNETLAQRRILVHGRHRMRNGAHLHCIRPAGLWRHRSDVRGNPNVSRRGTLLEDDPGAQGVDLLHGAHGDSFACQSVGSPSLRDKKTGYFTIMGRIDDVLNVSGHRLGTMEVESALVAHPIVAEAAVVGRPDMLTGEAICAFVVLKQARPEGSD